MHTVILSLRMKKKKLCIYRLCWKVKFCSGFFFCCFCFLETKIKISKFKLRWSSYLNVYLSVYEYAKRFGAFTWFLFYILKFLLSFNMRSTLLYVLWKFLVQQVQGKWKLKNANMAELCTEAKKLVDKFVTFQIEHVLRVCDYWSTFFTSLVTDSDIQNYTLC